MGSFFTNFQIHNSSTAKVAKILPKIITGEAYFSPANNGWVTVYTEESETQAKGVITNIAAKMSKELKTEVFGFMVHDSDIAVYWLYRNGKIVDEFNSCPDYFGEEIDNEECQRVRGNTDALLPLCIVGTQRDDLDSLLHSKDDRPAFAEEVLRKLAGFLGIDSDRMTLGLKYFKVEGKEILKDFSAFESVTNKAVSAKEEAAVEIDPAPIIFTHAVCMLIQGWLPEFNARMNENYGDDAEVQKRKLLDASDALASKSLAFAKGVPSFDEIKSARDAGPDAMAALIAKQFPETLTTFGALAAKVRMECFLEALLKQGLNPNKADGLGRITLQLAERHGKDSSIYKLVKTAAEEAPK